MADYRIVVQGRLGERFASAFVGLSVVSENAETVLVGNVLDQAHLHGILERIRDLGLELLRVEQVEP